MANYPFQLEFRPFAAMPSISALPSSPAMKNLFLLFVHILATIAKLLSLTQAKERFGPPPPRRSRTAAWTPGLPS